jgi:hypothetical protein
MIHCHGKFKIIISCSLQVFIGLIGETKRRKLFRGALVQRRLQILPGAHISRQEHVGRFTVRSRISSYLQRGERFSVKRAKKFKAI